MRLRHLSTVFLALSALLVSPFVLAHSGGGHLAGLADGFMHPATGLDHLLIAIAAGFWAGRAGDHSVRDAGFYLSLLLAGMLLGAAYLVFPQLSLAPTLIVVVTVVLVALVIAMPHAFLYIFFGGFAIYHGIVHVLEMPSVVSAYVFGLFISTGLMLMLGLILQQVIVTRKKYSNYLPAREVL